MGGEVEAGEVSALKRGSDSVEKRPAENSDAYGRLHCCLYKRLAEQSRAKEGPERHVEPSARHAAHVKSGVWPGRKQKDAEKAVALSERDGPHLELRDDVSLTLRLPM